MKLKFLLLLPLLAAGTAMAQNAPNSATPAPNPALPAPGAATLPTAMTQGPLSMQTLDTDRDGKLSPSEAAVNSSLTGQFVTLDRNGDGALDQGEFARFEVTSSLSGATSGTGANTGSTGTGTTGTSGSSLSAPGTQPSGTPPSSTTRPSGTTSSQTQPRQ